MFCEQKYEQAYQLNPSKINEDKLKYVKKIKYTMFGVYTLFIFAIIITKLI